MAIKLHGTSEIDAAREQVWQMLFDVEVMKKIANKVPGVTVDRLIKVSDDKYEGSAVIGVAMVKGKYDGNISVIERREPEFVRLRADGKGGGNWTSGEVALTLTDRDGKTQMAYEGTGNVSGPLATLGQRLIDTVGKQFIAAGVKAFAEEIAAQTKARGEL